MHSPTPNYGLVRPEETDPMSDFETQINANWDTVAGIPAPNSGTTLPQSGSYNVGDRFYKSDTKSIYILVTKDSTWGWYWRPVQDAISPWFVVPTTALSIGGWTLNPVAANPFAIALDNRGMCYWRGVIGPSAGTISRNVSHSVFPCPPIGIRPRMQGVFMLGHQTLAVNTTATSLQSYQGARIYIDNAGGDTTVRCFGGTAEFNRVHLGGAVQYATGNAVWYTP